MDYRKLFSFKVLISVLIAFVVIVALIRIFFPLHILSQVIPDIVAPPPISSAKDTSVIPLNKSITTEKMLTKTTELDTSNADDADIQEQLDRDRQQQKLTKDLKNKLEQTNLELDQEKALAEINKLKRENIGAFNESTVDGQSSLPEIKVEYIGGDSVKKEAILTIGNTSYQVKEKSSPTDNIQVVSISDSSVTLHFSAPQDLTKTIEYKPE